MEVGLRIVERGICPMAHYDQHCRFSMRMRETVLFLLPI